MWQSIASECHKIPTVNSKLIKLFQFNVIKKSRMSWNLWMSIKKQNCAVAWQKIKIRDIKNLRILHLARGNKKIISDLIKLSAILALFSRSHLHFRNVFRIFHALIISYLLMKSHLLTFSYASYSFFSTCSCLLCCVHSLYFVRN